MEPTSFTVKEESGFKAGESEFAKTKLMTRLTYTLDGMTGSFKVRHSPIRSPMAPSFNWPLACQSRGCATPTKSRHHSSGRSPSRPRLHTALRYRRYSTRHGCLRVRDG
jgi:hypothetical protein